MRLYVIYHIRQIIQGGNFRDFCGFLLTTNVLPLKIFLEYRRRPLTTQSMVPPGLKFSTAKVFPTYILSLSNESRKFSPSNDLMLSLMYTVTPCIVWLNNNTYYYCNLCLAI